MRRPWPKGSCRAKKKEEEEEEEEEEDVLRWLHRTVRWLVQMIRNVTEGTIHCPL